MNYEDLISVIVCTYNQQDTIRRTLDSILAQKCHLPIEIVIGEDCSTDDTLAICREYENQHPNKIHILANKPNKGFVRNYFDCIRACRGKYIADCSGDDFWIDDTKLEQSSLILEKEANVGIVHTDWLRYDEKTGKMTSPGKPLIERCTTSDAQCSIFNGKDLLTDILMPGQRPAIHLCTSLYRNDWVQRAMTDYPQFFDPNTYRCEDMQIAFFMAHMGDVAYIDKPTLAYSCGKNTISNPDSEEKQFSFWANATRLSFDLASTFHISDKKLDNFFQARIHKLLMHAFRSGNTSLRTEALHIQREMGISNNRQISIAKIIMLPGVWPVMRCLRNFVKNKK
jgi:glucosyltransferase